MPWHGRRTVGGRALGLAAGRGAASSLVSPWFYSTGDPVLQRSVWWSRQDEGEEPAVSNCRERLVGSWSMCCLWTKGRGHPMSRGSGEDSDALPAHRQRWADFSYGNVLVIG